MNDLTSDQPGSKPSNPPPANPDRANPPEGSNPPSNEAPDRDTPAWEGAEPAEAVGLVDPRHEIPMPPGL